MQAVHDSEPFVKFIKMSVIAHVALVGFLTVRFALFPGEQLQFADAIRVDLVGLPDKVPLEPVTQAPPAKETKPEPVAKPEPPPTPEAPAAKPTPPKVSTKPGVKPKDVTKSQQNAIDRLKAMEAIEKMKKSTATKPTNSQASSQAYKGNAVSAGNSLTGLSKVQYNEYLGDLNNRVKANWALPPYLENSGLTAQVLVKIDERGFVVHREIVKSSGNEIFDNQALAAVDRSSPVGEPPARIAPVLESEGIIFRFPY